jgi:antitoxin component YwqK of YwqJK toxin-antitoxin module
MNKLLLTLLISLFSLTKGTAQESDTTITYFKHAGVIVTTVDSAEYIRLIIRQRGQTLLDVNEYYTNGKPKLIGKTNPDPDRFFLNLLSLQGSCITFFPNGHRKSIDNYDKGNKTGECVEYYPTGKIYCIKKYYDLPEPVYLTCYDSTGREIANKGNGHWIIYDVDFKYVTMEGPVKSGYKNLNWQGHVVDSVTKKFISTYNISFKNNFLMWSYSYDNEGKKHSFYKPIEPPAPKDGYMDFIYDSKKALKISPDADLHTPVKISFDVDKMGHLSNIVIDGDANSALKEKLAAVLAKTKDWSTGKFFGVERGFRITVPLVDKNDHGMYSYVMLNK